MQEPKLQNTECKTASDIQMECDYSAEYTVWSKLTQAEIVESDKLHVSVVIDVTSADSSIQKHWVALMPPSGCMELRQRQLSSTAAARTGSLGREVDVPESDAQYPQLL